MPKDIIAARQVFNPEGAMEDAIDLTEWEEKKEEVRELRIPITRISRFHCKRWPKLVEYKHVRRILYIYIYIYIYIFDRSIIQS